jgi:hypothetical protein
MFESNLSLVYNDSKGKPTIGVGLNLAVSDNMALVLNQMTVGGHNVFDIVAQIGITAQEVVSEFEGILTKHPLPADGKLHDGTDPSETSLQTALNNELKGYFGEIPTATPCSVINLVACTVLR